MNFTDITPDSLFGGDTSNPIMWLVWIVPIVFFVFYGQRIQLYVTSNEINKGIEKLQKFRDESKTHLVEYLQKNFKITSDATRRVDEFIEYFTIMPVDMDPSGVIQKVKHLMRSREDYTRSQVKLICNGVDGLELSKVQNLLEVATSLHLLHKIIRHLFLTAKKQNNFPLILP
ncbi:MAG: DUF1512 family protein, partial [Candidatus Nitrosotenuis sp.]|nr:DUF1512 family protein [Candidatus Nitrosotenuis sp.]